MKDPRFAKFLLFVNALVPLALLGWDAYQQRLGANPIEYALHTTGLLALIFLVLSLCVTPLRKLSGRNWLSHFRRMLGLFAFFYACLHFLIYLIDRDFSLASAFNDAFGPDARKIIVFGMAALLSMVPLALTSTNGMVKRLGALRWKRLHRLAYVAAIAAAIHYFLVGKVIEAQAVVFASIVALLLAYRLVARWLPAFRQKPPVSVPSEPGRATSP